jgi:hypothetical protein
VSAAPDREYYVEEAERLGSNRARLSLARKLLKRSYDLLSEFGEEANGSRMTVLVRAR